MQILEAPPRSDVNPKLVLNTWLVGEVQEMIQKFSKSSDQFRLFNVEEFHDGFKCTLKLPRSVLLHLGFQPVRCWSVAAVQLTGLQCTFHKDSSWHVDESIYIAVQLIKLKSATLVPEIPADASMDHFTHLSS